MKKFIVFIVIVLAGFYYYLEHDLPEKPKRVIRVGVECAFAPNNWEEDKPSKTNVPLVNNPGFYADGYDIQIAKQVAEDIGAELEVLKIDWNDLFDALNGRKIDVIFSGMLDTEEREKIIAFTEPYEAQKIEYAVVVNKKSPYNQAKTFEDLRGARLLAQSGTKLNDAIDQIPGVVHIAPVSTVAVMLDNLINFRVDGIVINLDTGQSYVRTYSNLTLIRFPEGQGFKLGFNGICAGVRKSDTKLLAELNESIHKITAKDRLRIMDRAVARTWENL